jgi:hypothetical protein
MVKLLRLLRLVKTLRLVKIASIMDKYDIALFDAMPMINVSKIVLVMLLLGHVFGSFFWFFSQDDWRTEDELEMINNGELSLPWIDSQFPDGTGNATLLSKYIPSMYWAFTTMTTTGKVAAPLGIIFIIVIANIVIIVMSFAIACSIFCAH